MLLIMIWWIISKNKGIALFFFQAIELEAEAYPLQDELTTKIISINMERVRR